MLFSATFKLKTSFLAYVLGGDMAKLTILSPFDELHKPLKG